MLDENLPTYHFQQSTENPLHTILYFTYQGSEPSAEYLIKRPPPSDSPNQYAFGLFDIQYSHVLYAEILLHPEWSQPTLSAAELRAQGPNNQPPATAITPDGFTIDLYNPDQAVVVKPERSRWGRSDAWEFEVPERSFRTPTASKVDAEVGQELVPELIPKVMFRWKRDSRLSKDMTCYMSGKSVGGKKNKEPDITVALFRQARHESNVTIYEPNMARVDVEDRKGLEVILLLTAEIIRDLYLVPRSDPFNTAGAPAPTPQQIAAGRRRGSSPLHVSNAGTPAAVVPGAHASHKLPASSPSSQPVDAEARRLQEAFAREEREARERRDREEQQRIKRMLEEEEARERQRRQAEVDAETERLRREYGVQGQERRGSTPSLPPRPNGGGGLSPPPIAASGANGGWFSGPVRPTSAGPSWGGGGGGGGGGGDGRRPHFAPPPTSESYGGKKKPGPYQLGSSAAATMSGFFGRGEDSGKKKVKKKRSVHF
ncbi:hypothetical protein NLU13_4650 [Sarocladium strictum]|uniref:Uncharacterized protein n=1 Tax=Sarocladium strictum TaxID=5046 RepID=A0AA39GJX7_SARSR|nr:hypothetical protein NLU13_4650 [Sarocladium strictum]